MQVPNFAANSATEADNKTSLQNSILGYICSRSQDHSVSRTVLQQYYVNQKGVSAANFDEALVSLEYEGHVYHNGDICIASSSSL